MAEKIFIYQVFPRLFGNTKSVNKENGSLEENGVGKFSTFSAKALSEIKKMGFTHVWFMGVLEHASKTDYSAHGIPKDNPDVVKGNAGSPYAIRDYYDVSPDLADNVENRIEEFEELISRTHKAGLKVIIDFVPNHVARQYHSDSKPRKIKDLGEDDNKDVTFSPDNNYYYVPGQDLELQFQVSVEGNTYKEFPAKVTGNDRFDNKPDINDWYETVKLNYGVDYLDGRKKYFTPVPDTWYKMREVILYWASKGVDGFRCDMAELVPVEFWNWLISRVKPKYKSLIFIAEVYNPAEYRNYTYTGKFDYLYDKVGLYDTLKSIMVGERPASDITFCWQKLEDLQSIMLNFLENHDEQRIASDFFAKDPFKAIPAMMVSTMMGKNPIMIYFGQELGERGMDKEGFSGLDGKTTIFDYWSVESLRNWYNDGNFGTERLTADQVKLRDFYVHLMKLSNNEDAVAKGSFFDLMYVNYDNAAFDPTKQYTFFRSYNNEVIFVVVNFDDRDVEVNVNIPTLAFEYMEVNSTDYKSYKDLCTGKIQKLKLGWENEFKTIVPANSGKILKLLTK